MGINIGRDLHAHETGFSIKLNSNKGRGFDDSRKKMTAVLVDPGEYDASERTPLLSHNTPSSSSSAHHYNHDRETSSNYYTQLSTMSASSNQMTQSIFVRNLSVDSAISIPNGNNSCHGHDPNEPANGNSNNGYEAANYGSNSNELSFKEHFQMRLVSQYPLKYVIIHSLFSVLLSSGMIVCERLQDNHFTLNDVTVLSYRTLNGFILWAAATNILYSIMALVTSKNMICRHFIA